MPPSNAIQGGKVHPVAANSGSYLQLALARRLDGYSGFTAKPYSPDSRFANNGEYKDDDAVQAAAASGYKYCLIARLGEFRDAFPMTFRDDFVTLNDARLIDVQTKAPVWALTSTYRASGTNLGSYYPLLDEIARKIANSIVEKDKPTTSKMDPASSNVSLASSPQATTVTTSVNQNLEKLKTLKQARDEGILTESEYQRKRKSIVEGL